MCHFRAEDILASHFLVHINVYFGSMFSLWLSVLLKLAKVHPEVIITKYFRDIIENKAE